MYLERSIVMSIGDIESGIEKRDGIGDKLFTFDFRVLGRYGSLSHRCGP